MKYSADEARSLKDYKELPPEAKINETDTFGDGEEGTGFEFGEDASDDSSDDGDGKGEGLDIDKI